MRVALLVLSLAAFVAADQYLLFPPGSNNRNRERQENRNNAQRMFDSENNAKGGYPWRGDPDGLPGKADEVTYYVESELQLMWANQHGCGPNEQVHCEVIIQYGCEDTMPGLRDGYAMGAPVDLERDNNNDGTQGMYFAREFNYNRDAPQGEGSIDEITRGDNTIPVVNSQTGLTFGNPSENIPVDQVNEIADFYRGDITTVAGKKGVEYGMHENYEYYQRCTQTQRNKGLYNADQQLNGNSARFTRQEDDGTRHGLECNEERDYYPYWSPTPWKDMVILPQKTEWCSYYKGKSRNTNSVWWCDCDAECRSNSEDNLSPIFERECRDSGGQWTEAESWGLSAPDCIVHPYSADNNLGMAYYSDVKGESKMSGYAPQPALYKWTVPKDAAGPNPDEGQLCVIRIRYNITTTDYISHEYLTNHGNYIDSVYNCPEGGAAQPENDYNPDQPQCAGNITESSVPFGYEDPYVKMFADLPELSIALDTAQNGRTFQDRTHVFRVANKPNGIPDGVKIFNLGTRGRRGNIVQSYPSMEYIFAPDRLVVKQGDWISINLHASDFNDNTAGEGWQYSDRHNMVEMYHPGDNFPKHPSDFSLFPENVARALMMPEFDPPSTYDPSLPYKDYTGMTLDDCVSYEHYTYVTEVEGNPNGEFPDNLDFEQYILNCGKMNHAGNLLHVDFEVTAAKDKMYWYVNTRNNNFSNRSHKGAIVVVDQLTAGEIAGIVIAVVSVVGAAAGVGIWRWRARSGSMASGQSSV